MQFRNWMKKIEERRRKGWLKRRQLIVCNNTSHIDDIHVKFDYITRIVYSKNLRLFLAVKFWHFHRKKIFRWKRNKIKNKIYWIDTTMKVLPISQNMEDDSFLTPQNWPFIFFNTFKSITLTRYETICNFDTWPNLRLARTRFQI